MANRFHIALSYPGEHRDFVLEVAEALAAQLTRDRVFYDEWYEVELLGGGGDLKLQAMYEQADLVIPFFSRYYDKPWCSMEWETIRGMLLNRRKDDAVIPVHMDDTDVPGWSAVNFGIRLCGRTPQQIASIILQALAMRNPNASTATRPLQVRPTTPPSKPPTAAASPVSPILPSASALAIWQEKLDYLLQQEAISLDPSQKFSLKKQIEEAKQRIEELENPESSLRENVTSPSAIISHHDHAAGSVPADSKVESRFFALGVITLLFSMLMAAWGFLLGDISPLQHWILRWLFPLAFGIAAGSFFGSMTAKAKGPWPGVVATATGGFSVWLLTSLILPDPLLNASNDEISGPHWQATDWKTYYSDEFKDEYAKLNASGNTDAERVGESWRPIYLHVKQVEPRGPEPNIRIVIAQYEQEKPTKMPEHDAIVNTMTADIVSIEAFRIRRSPMGEQPAATPLRKEEFADGRRQLGVPALDRSDTLWVVMQLERADGIFPQSGSEVPFNLEEHR